MKTTIKIIASMIILCVMCLFQTSCVKKDEKPTIETMGLKSKLDYFIFGHIGSNCNCQILYKVKYDSVFTSGVGYFYDPQLVIYKPFLKPTDIETFTLYSQIPNALFEETNLHIGTRFPDMGHYYFEVSESHIVRKWYVESENVPSYLKPFLNKVDTVMKKLN